MKETDAQIRENKKALMLDEPMHRLIPKMALPTIIAFLITSIYGLADTYFVSSLGTNATAAVGVNSSLDNFISMAGSVFAIGANSCVARLLGSGNEKRANQVLSTAFFSALALGLIIGVVGLTCLKSLVILLGATDTCLQYAMDYARYVLLAAPYMAISFVMNQCLRAEGSALFSMFGLGFGGVLNCVLDPIFILGLGLGVKGASIATAISKLVSVFILLFPYLTGRTVLKISPRSILPEGALYRQVLSMGAPSLCRNALSVISGIFINSVAGTVSDACLAAVGVANKVMMFPFSVALGLGSGFQPVAGYNWGAHRYDRVRGSFRFTVKLGFGLAIVMGGLLGIFSNRLTLLFSEADPELQQLGSLCIRLQCIALPAHIWVATVNMYCAGLGLPFRAFLLSTARQGTCFLPIVYLMARVWGANGIMAVQAVADGLTLLLGVPILLTVNRRIRTAELAENS